MAAGVVYQNLHALNLNEIQGFGRNKPLLKVIFLMGAFSIGGIPGWSGYVSKTLLHESIVEYIGELAVLGEPVWKFRAIEWIFLITGGMTIAYMTKLFVAVFVEQHPVRQKEFDAKKHYMNGESTFALVVPTILLVILGFFPYQTMNRLADLSEGFLHGGALEEEVHYFAFGNLKGAMVSLAIGALVYFGFIRKFLMKKEKGSNVYQNVWPTWMDLEELIYRPVLQKGVLTVVAGISKMVDQMYVTRGILKALLQTAAFFCRICDQLLDGVLLFFRSTTHRSATERHVYLIGTKFSRTLGRILDNIVALLNRTFYKNHPIERSFVVDFAEWEEVMHKTNRLIGASLSFGLMLAAIGLALTLIYVLWW